MKTNVNAAWLDKEPTVIEGKVFDGDSNPLPNAKLLTRRETVDGDECVVVALADVGVYARNEEYDGELRPIVAADDLLIAVPVDLTEKERRWLDGIALFVNEPGPVNGADLTEYVERMMVATGREILDNADEEVSA